MIVSIPRRSSLAMFLGLWVNGFGMDIAICTFMLLGFVCFYTTQQAWSEYWGADLNSLDNDKTLVELALDIDLLRQQVYRVEV